MKHYFILLIGFLFYSKGWAQTYPYVNLTIKDGLPSNTVYSIFSDSKGYLWFCTDKGLAKYNGKIFQSFSISTGLPDNEIFSVTEDTQGRLWLATYNGELCFYKDGTFHTKANTPWLKLPFNNHVSNVTLEKDGSITFAYIGFKFLVNISGNRVAIYDLSKLGNQMPLNGEAIIIVEKRSANKFRIFTTDYSAEIDTLGNLIEPPKKLKRPYWPARVNNKPDLVYFDGIYSLDEKLLLPLKHMAIFDKIIILKNKKDFWAGRINGLFINDTIPVITNQYITSICQDKELNHWISTREHGAYFLNRNMTSFRVWTGAYQGVVQHVAGSGSSLSFITDSGSIYRLDGENLKRTYSIDNKYLSVDKKRDIFYGNSNGDYFVVSITNGLALKHNEDGSYTMRDISQSIKKMSMRSFKYLFQHKAELYFMGINTVFRSNFDALLNGQVSNYDKLLNDPLEKRMYAYAENAADGSIWMARANGLYKLVDTQATQQVQYKQTSFRHFKFYDNYLLGYTDKNQFLICSNYKGKVIVDTLKTGNCIYENIRKIDKTRALIVTNNYYQLLQLYPPSPNGKPNYSVKIIEDPFIPLHAEYIYSDSSYCYFFKEGTITRVAISALFAPIQPPSPLFSTLKVGAKIYAIQQKIVIPYSEADNINITFDEISFLGKDITSQYSISENNTDQWVDITGNEINLNSPGYGTFTIKVRSKTLSSAYSRPAVLVLKIERPFWATWWFVTLCILALLGIIWGIILLITWRKLRKKQKEHEADMKFQQSEYKALNALMNPHFIFNSLNNIQGLINKDEKRTANEYLVIFSDLVRQNMHNISKGFISLQEELTLIENYLTLEKLRFKELVNYNIKIEEDVDVDDIMIPPLMIQPLVENAVKHGLLPMQSARARVSIEVYEREDMLYIIIEDNGIGLTASLKSQNKLHESFGLSNLQKRTDHLKKIQQQEFNIEITEMKDSDGTVLGTKVVVTLQLG